MSSTNPATPEKLLLIDTDPGVDDCLALMMILARSPGVRVVAITSANGNVGLHAVTRNAVRIVKLFDMLDQVPIYKGCLHPMVETLKPKDSGYYHGKDGLGDVPNVEPPASDDLIKRVQDMHAVNAIICLAKQYSGDLEIVCLGSLTNLAMAYKLDPDLPKHLKALHVLGGTIRGYGNITPAAEYNFYTYPEAAYTILRSFPSLCPTQVLPFEVPLDLAVPTDWFNHVISGSDKKSTFFREVSRFTRNLSHKVIASGVKAGYNLCDSYMAAVVLDPAAVEKSKMVRMGVELIGNMSRGSLVIDHLNKDSPYLSPVPIKIIEKINMDVYKKLVAQTFQA